MFQLVYPVCGTHLLLRLQEKKAEDGNEFLAASSGVAKRKQQEDFDDLFDFACVLDEEKEKGGRKGSGKNRSGGNGPASNKTRRTSGNEDDLREANPKPKPQRPQTVSKARGLGQPVDHMVSLDAVYSFLIQTWPMGQGL